MKSVQIRSFFWSVFSCIQTECEDLRIKSPYSVRIQENTDQKKLCIWTLFTLCVNPFILTGKFWSQIVLVAIFGKISIYFRFVTSVLTDRHQPSWIVHKTFNKRKLLSPKSFAGTDES